MNINEIAKLAGVSRATVSRYLNQGYVSEEKRDQIRRVIEETGYQPSSQAQMLRTKKTKLIGVIIPKINSDTVSRMVAGISDVLARNSYQLLLANTNNDVNEELKYLNLFRDNQVDGVILIGTIFTKKHLKMLKECKVPVVVLGQKLEGYSCVYQDDFHAAKKMTECLLKTGKTIGYIGVTTKDEAAGLNRKQGFEAAFEAADILQKAYMKEADFSIQAGYEKAKELLTEVPEVDTIFCATDNIAIGAMMYCRESQRKVPEEIQFAGVGDTPMAKVVYPPLTTVHFYYKTSGMEAAEMLVAMLETEEYIRKEIKMGYEIVWQDSTRT